jgi:hypothetical protein
MLAPNDISPHPTRQPGRLPHNSIRLMKSLLVEQASRLLGGRAVNVNPCVGAASRVAVLLTTQRRDDPIVPQE